MSVCLGRCYVCYGTLFYVVSERVCEIYQVLRLKQPFWFIDLYGQEGPKEGRV